MGSSSSQPEPQSSFFSMSTPEADLEHQSLQTQMQRQHRQPAMSGCCTGGRKAHKEAVNSNAYSVEYTTEQSCFGPKTVPVVKKQNGGGCIQC
mmetsp:Transcript_30863/g.55234  ORF Transcript_30863/g.55234 Transcript_30863/m.55234 type:complete len:93 (+) Transcript_30863:98-376(+)